MFFGLTIHLFVHYYERSAKRGAKFFLIQRTNLSMSGRSAGRISGLLYWYIEPCEGSMHILSMRLSYLFQVWELPFWLQWAWRYPSGRTIPLLQRRLVYRRDSCGPSHRQRWEPLSCLIVNGWCPCLWRHRVKWPSLSISVDNVLLKKIKVKVRQ